MASTSATSASRAALRSSPSSRRRRDAARVAAPPPRAAAKGGGLETGARDDVVSVSLESVLNFRDLASAGGSIAPGRVFRTATPGNASEADAAIVLNDLGVKRLLDLRSEDEFEADPGPLQSAFPEIISFTRNVDGVDDPLLRKYGKEAYDAYLRRQSDAAFLDGIDDATRAGALVRYHAPLLEYERYYLAIYDRLTAVEKVKAAVFTAQAFLYDDTNQKELFVGKVNAGGLPLLNEVMVDGSGPEIRAALKVIAKSTAAAPTAFYCKAGKDRTGLVAALTLHCAGLSEDEITEDYHKSEGTWKAALGGGRIERGVNIDYSRFYGSPKAVMEGVLAYVKTNHGSVDGYLDSIGFDASDREALRAALCD